MTTAAPARARAAAGAGVLLLLLALWGHSPAELARRAVFLQRFAPRELAVRRAGGSGTAFDRPYFVFLEAARRRLPASARGVVIVGAPSADPYLFLAAYQMAPRPVRLGSGEVPEGWVIASYGFERPAGMRTLSEWSGGALLDPAP